VFDMNRANVKEHVGLGHGTHFCVGAPLARLETQIALDSLLSRVGDIRLSARNDFEPYPGLSSRSLKELHIEFDAV